MTKNTVPSPGFPGENTLETFRDRPHSAGSRRASSPMSCKRWLTIWAWEEYRQGKGCPLSCSTSFLSGNFWSSYFLIKRTKPVLNLHRVRFQTNITQAPIFPSGRCRVSTRKAWLGQARKVNLDYVYKPREGEKKTH